MFAIRVMLNENLMSSIGKRLDEISKIFTFVTDCAQTMGRAVNVSVSENLVPFLRNGLGACRTYSILP